MKNKGNKILLSVLLLVLLSMTGYFLLAIYYRNGFALNTWINGVYCTGKSVEEVNSELLGKVEAPIIIITDKEGFSHEISLADADYQADYVAMLHKFKQEQNPYFWIDNITFHRNHEVTPLASYDGEKLKALFYNLPCVQKEINIEPDYFITWNTAEEGYQLSDTLSGRMDAEKAFFEVADAIDAGVTTIDLTSLDCYYDIAMTAEQEQTKLLWEKIDCFQNCGLVYDMGAEKIAFTPAITAHLLETSGEGKHLPVFDENGELMLNREAVEAFVSDLAADYDTYGKDREFNSTRGDVITLTKGNYGTTLNQKAEVEYLMENLLSGELHAGVKVEHIPEYKREAFVRGLEDIGGTYIEIDMTDQKLYYYVEQEIKVETDVVTGNLRRKMGTPSGVYYVYNKQTDRILRGQGYASPVDYWMPVKGGIGIHDADWRKEFGGEIYKTNGSHGCINVPPEVMPELYEMVEIGTPVIMFY